MFIYQPTATQNVQNKLDKIKKEFGILPPHWELLALLAPERFEMFIQEISYLMKHPNIDKDFFALLRFYIASKEDFSYCKSFNTKLLLAKNYDKKILQNFKKEITNIPLNNQHKLLAQKAIKALYQPHEFTHHDIEALKNSSWNDTDIYDAIDHAAFVFKVSKILKAYLA